MQTVRKERKDLLLASGRISPREVLEAYEKTGLKPMFDDWKTATHACAIYVVAAAETGKTMLRASAAKEHIRGRGVTVSFPNYLDGFAAGFDGQRREKNYYTWSTGYRDGRRCRRFVLARLGAGRTGAGEAPSGRAG